MAMNASSRTAKAARNNGEGRRGLMFLLVSLFVMWLFLSACPAMHVLFGEAAALSGTQVAGMLGTVCLIVGLTFVSLLQRIAALEKALLDSSRKAQ